MACVLSPGRAGQFIDKDGEHAAKGVCDCLFRQNFRLRRRQQRAHVGQQTRVSQLGEHPFLGLGPGHRLAGQVEILPEHLDHSGDIEILEDLQCVREVVEIAPLMTLQQRTQLG